ncbi:MAG: sulfatase-like hydrolase/transferase, partial [Pseudomonadales bacterium]|nr:sulfatase-like hydrolase/transferase [Pseudomonadales bacterium]NIX07455.1 sulfatase-like hydrolase/transferase [Pseudomonadales bacterium]
DGVHFLSAYATAAICAPSRAALLTGRYQNRFGFESQPMQRYV